MFGVGVDVNELRGIIIRRNELAFYINSDRFPPTLRDDMRSCQWCHQLDNCVLYHRAVENGTIESSGMGKLFEARVTHLTEDHIKYFLKWDKLIDLEKSDIQVF